MLVSPDKQLQQLLRDLITNARGASAKFDYASLVTKQTVPYSVEVPQSPKTPSRIAA
jgi:hypothetical protein